ncbi:MAG: hypothetical protein ACI9FU_000954 [Granulosicoccus sp.]|jgi:hypothetical protein
MIGKRVFSSASRLVFITLTVFHAMTVHFCAAQNLSNEFIVFNNGDTLFGDISYEEAWIDGLKRFHEVEITYAEGNKSRYSPDQVASYQVLNNSSLERYETTEPQYPLSLGSKKKFMKLLVDGKVNLYQWKYDISRSRLDSTINYESRLKRKIRTDHYYKKQDSIIRVPRNSFSKVMAKYFADHRKLSSLIQGKGLGRNDLHAIADFYNGSSGKPVKVPAFEPGFVLLESGAKLYGRLRKISPSKSCDQIIFLNEENHPKKIEKHIIKAYKRGAEFYEKKTAVRPISKKDPNVFMKKIVQGKLNLFKYVFLSYDGRLTNKNEVVNHNQNMDEADLYFEKDSVLTLVTRVGFNKNMASYFQDCLEILERIESREFQFRHLKSLVLAYNSICE